MSSSDSSSNSTTSPKHFINDSESSVMEYIQGLLLQYPNRLVKLAHHSVLLGSHTHIHPSRPVYVLSGGGIGHEPAHAGYIASNMLSGAILGGIFASPSVSSILAAIRTLCFGNHTTTTAVSSCLLIVKNYTGDRLNFGMACELANSQGIPCQMILVADDVAIPSSSSNKHTPGPRGLAGTVLVHKVAGAAAHRNMTLDQVVFLAQSVASRVKTMGVALDAVTLPGASTVNTRLEGQIMEMGLGIHGEAGWYQCPTMSVRDMIPILISKIYIYGQDVEEEKPQRSSSSSFEKGDDLLVLINNLGGTSNFEMSIVAQETVQYLESINMGYCCHVTRLYVGSFMTSFNMHGISISILSLNQLSPLVLELLDEETDAPGWNPVDIWKPTGEIKDEIRPSMVQRIEPPVDSLLPPLDSLQQPPLSHEASTLISQRIQAACQSLIDSEPLLTQYDTIVGDGDCGITMQRGAKEIMSRLHAGTLPIHPPTLLLTSLADAISASMGGTSGILLELLFRKMSTCFKHAESSSSSVTLWIQALKQGVDAMSFYGGATKGSRTMLDALYPAVESLQVSSCLTTCAQAATLGANQTANMTHASAGRSNYLREESLVGTPDPGAIAVSLVFQAMANVVEEKTQE